MIRVAGFDVRERIVIAVKKLISLLVALSILAVVASAPPALAAADSTAVTQADAEDFVRSFYRDLEGDDLDKVMAHFDRTVQYYASGPKERAFIAKVIRQLFAAYPSRTFSATAVKLKPLATPDRVTVNFDLRSFLRSAERDATTSARAEVEWDLVKRDGACQITRFTATPVPGPASSPSS